MKGVDFKNMPPSSDALRQLVPRAAYVSGHYWGNSLSPIMNSPDPTLWGLKLNEAKTTLTPIMTTLPGISAMMPELMHCNCMKSCKPPCKCTVNNQICTILCKCSGNCYKE